VRDKRGSGYGSNLTERFNLLQASSVSSGSSAPTSRASAPSTIRANDPIQFTPGKSPSKKKTKKSRSKAAPSDPSQFEKFCQTCLKSETKPSTLWVGCDHKPLTECGRWFHYECVPEFKDLTPAEVKFRNVTIFIPLSHHYFISLKFQLVIKKIDWFCPICIVFGREKPKE
jgi:hypothetical protein